MLIETTTLSTLQNTDSVASKMYGFKVFMGLGFELMASTASLGALLEYELQDSSRCFINPPSDTHSALAVAQGVITQARILGSSAGIAASTAILRVMESRN